MKHLILGTAGHIDHGKTALVKALTGIDCDTHKEEKRRGITINLGFAHLSLPSGDMVGIVDVPGHRDFIHTMVAGASGIDCVLMVIAADSGVMPQTREHLAICEVLGVSRGIVVVTKTDVVDIGALAGVHDRIAAFTKGTFLQTAPLVDVSSVTGSGIKRLVEVITETLDATVQRPAGAVFRMYIDRIFSVSGFGTVVTGSVKSGTLRTNAPAFLLPPKRELRIRRIERYGVEVAEVTAGDRASLNVVGLSKEEFERGMLVSDRPLSGAFLLDAKLRLFDAVAPLGRWSQGQFILGTYEAQVRVHLIEKDRVQPGQTVLAQIHLPSPCCAAVQDAFVLRSSSGDATIGGGEIIDPRPLHHKRTPGALVAQLRELSEGNAGHLVAMETSKHPAGIDHVSLAEALNLSPSEILEIIASQLPPGVMVFRSNEGTFLLSQKQFEILAELLKKSLADFHRTHPFAGSGRTIEELQGILHVGEGQRGRQMTEVFLGRCIELGIVKRVGNSISLASHTVRVSSAEARQIGIIEEFFKASGMQTPIYADCVLLARKHGIEEKRLEQIVRYLTAAKILYAIEGQFLHRSVVDECRKKLVDELHGKPQGLTVAQFRDLVGGNRKICLLLYALFDAEGVTERQGDVRVLVSAV